MNLETRIDNLQDKWIETTAKLADKPVYKYAVDVLSGWIYYTPTYALQEYASGKEWDAVLTTRLLGLLVQAAVIRPVGMIRNYLAKKRDVTKESTTWDKFKLNFISGTPVQAATYGLMLMGSMAWTGDWDWKASGIAYGVGVILGAAHSIPYGFVQDKFRTYFGIKPAIDKKIIITQDNKCIDKYIYSDKKSL